MQPTQLLVSIVALTLAWGSSEAATSRRAGRREVTRREEQTRRALGGVVSRLAGQGSDGYAYVRRVRAAQGHGATYAGAFDMLRRAGQIEAAGFKQAPEPVLDRFRAAQKKDGYRIVEMKKGKAPSIDVKPDQMHFVFLQYPILIDSKGRFIFDYSDSTWYRIQKIR